MTFTRYIETSGLKLREVAEQLGISTSMVWQLRRGLSSPSLALSRRIFDWSEGEVNYLIADNIGSGVEGGAA